MDTSKYFHTQGSPGACVFSLFKMERANPSPVVCDGNRNHREYLCLRVCSRVRACKLSMHALITGIYVCVGICARLCVYVYVRVRDLYMSDAQRR